MIIIPTIRNKEMFYKAKLQKITCNITATIPNQATQKKIS